MTILNSEDSADSVSYTLNITKKTATFIINTFETIRNNLTLIDQMTDIFEEENIEYVYFKFLGRGKRKVKVEVVDEHGNKSFVYKEVPNDVCYECDNVKLVVVRNNNDREYLCPLVNFIQFYKANMNYIITNNIIHLSRMEKKPDKDGFTVVKYGMKKEKSKTKKMLKAKMNHISKNNRKDNSTINAIQLT